MKNKVNYLYSHIFLSIATITSVIWFVISIVDSNNIVDQLTKIISNSIFIVFIVVFLIFALKSIKEKQKLIILSSLILTIYSTFNILTSLNIIKLPTQKYMENFVNRSLTEVVKWSKENNIKIEQIYENSDNIKAYNIISQDINSGVLLKNVKELKVVVSSGPELTKEIILPSMLNRGVDDVINFVDKNFLTNVNIDFEINEESKDTIIYQNKTGIIKRNDEINFKASLGNQPPENVSMINLVGNNKFKALTWLKRNAIKYEVSYEYSNDVEKDFVISQNINEKEMINSNIVKLVISKGKQIKVINLKNLSSVEAVEWIINNNLKVSFTEEYDDTVKKGDIIRVSHLENSEVEEGTTIIITLSKGQVFMEEFKNLADFKIWADKYKISYNVEYKYDNNYKSGDIISISHKENTIIKNNDSITITISRGKLITIPNFIGKDKNSALQECRNIGLNCSVGYGGFDNNNADTVVSQNKRSNSNVSKGTSVHLTLSKGKAISYNVFIQDTWMIPGNPNGTKNTLLNKLSKAAPGVHFNVQFKTVNTGVGLITRDSPVKAGNNTFIQGRDYTIIVGTN